MIYKRSTDRHRSASLSINHRLRTGLRHNPRHSRVPAPGWGHASPAIDEAANRANFLGGLNFLRMTGFQDRAAIICPFRRLTSMTLSTFLYPANLSAKQL